jgi:hypothetical protein
MRKHQSNLAIVFSFLIMTGFCGYANLSLAATPAISNVSGSIATGQIITISGANMMDEDRSNWLSKFKTGSSYGFEGSSPSGDGYACTGGTYSSSVKLSGNKSIDYHVSGATGSGQLESRCWVDYTGSDYWVRGNVRWDATGGWPTNFIKMMLGEPGFYFQPQEGSSLPSKMRMNGFYPSIPSGQLESGRWYTIEAHIKRTSPTIFEGYMDGTFLGTESGAGGGNTWLEFGIINLSGTPSSFDMHHYWDNLVLSTSRAYPSSIIEVSNNSVYGQGTIKYQEPMTLGDSSSQIKLNLNGLGSGPFYLWVTNNRQERSAGYILSGESTDTIPPSPPKNVKAI